MEGVLTLSIPSSEAVIPSEAGLLRLHANNDIYTVDDRQTLLARGVLPSPPPALDQYARDLLAGRQRRDMELLHSRAVAACASSPSPRCGDELGFSPPGESAMGKEGSPVRTMLEDWVESGDHMEDAEWVEEKPRDEWNALLAAAGLEGPGMGIKGYVPNAVRTASLESTYLALAALDVAGVPDPDGMLRAVGFVMAQYLEEEGGFASRRVAGKGGSVVISDDAAPSLRNTYLAFRVLSAAARSQPRLVGPISAFLAPRLARIQAFVTSTQNADGGFGNFPIGTLYQYIIGVSNLRNTLAGLVLLEVDLPAWGGNDLPPLHAFVLPRAFAFARACIAPPGSGACRDDACKDYDLDAALLLRTLDAHHPWLTEKMLASPAIYLSCVVGIIISYLVLLFGIYSEQWDGLAWRPLGLGLAAVASASLSFLAILSIPYPALVVASGLALAGASLGGSYKLLKYASSGLHEALLTQATVLTLVHVTGIIAIFVGFPLLVPQLYGLYIPCAMFMVEAPLVAAVLRLFLYASDENSPDPGLTPRGNTNNALVGTLLASAPALVIQTMILAIRPDLGALLRMASIHGHTANIFVLLPVAQYLGGAFFTVIVARLLDTFVQPQLEEKDKPKDQ